MLHDVRLASAQVERIIISNLTKYYGVESQSICNGRDKSNKPRNVKLSSVHTTPVLVETLTKAIVLGLNNRASCVLKTVGGTV